jgi:hypothetical protein
VHSTGSLWFCLLFHKLTRSLFRFSDDKVCENILSSLLVLVDHKTVRNSERTIVGALKVTQLLKFPLARNRLLTG